MERAHTFVHKGGDYADGTSPRKFVGKSPDKAVRNKGFTITASKFGSNIGQGPNTRLGSSKKRTFGESLVGEDASPMSEMADRDKAGTLDESFGDSNGKKSPAKKINSKGELVQRQFGHQSTFGQIC